jgi:hypothetical protein
MPMVGSRGNVAAPARLEPHTALWTVSRARGRMAFRHEYRPQRITAPPAPERRVDGG